MESDLMTESEAAAYLGIGEKQLTRLAKKGGLATSPRRANRRYRKEDIDSLKDLNDRGLNPILHELRQTKLETKALKHELDRIKFLMGLNLPKLGVDRDSVISLLLRAEDALREPPTHDAEALMDWARTFHALTETHLEAITLYTDQKEPWRAFLNLGHKLCREQDLRVTQSSAELTLIYSLLNASLRSARRVAYFYVRELHGKSYARKIFPDAEGCVHENVIAMAFANVYWDVPR